MTDNEIIKAFEYCPQTRACAHTECPLFGYEEIVAECAAELNKKVRDLIQRQQERIEDLEALAMLKNKRHYYNRFIKEVWQVEHGELSYPDFDEIYKRYFELKERMDRIVEQLEKLRQEYPYKVVGEYDTYSTYNEAWSDCSDRAIAIVKGVQNE